VKPKPGAWWKPCERRCSEKLVSQPKRPPRNRSVGPALNWHSGFSSYSGQDSACTAKLKDRTLTKLYNERPAWLALAHQRLDSAVAAAYGWPADLTDEQILERLLALNLARAAEEAKATNVKKPKTTREKGTDELV
jgi:hypothetical protein